MPTAMPAAPAAKKKVRLQLSTAMAGLTVSHKSGSIITVDEDEALRHVANGNGSILDGPDEQSEIDRLRSELAKANAALAQVTQDAAAATPAKK